MAKEDAERIKQASIEQLQKAESIIYEWYHFIGETRVQKHIAQEYPIDYENDTAGNRRSWGEIIENPKGLRIFVKEYPPRLKQYGKVKFSGKLGYGDLRETWRWMLRHAIADIKAAGYTRVKNEKKVLIYRYHYKRVADPDQYNIMFLNDVIRDGRLIYDDDITNIQVHMCGIIDPDNPGTEIFILPLDEFLKHPEVILPNYKCGKQ